MEYLPSFLGFSVGVYKIIIFVITLFTVEAEIFVEDLISLFSLAV